MLVVLVIVAVVVVAAAIVDVGTVDDTIVVAGTVAIIVGTVVVLSSLGADEHAARSRVNTGQMSNRWRNCMMLENLFLCCAIGGSIFSLRPSNSLSSSTRQWGKLEK